MGRFDDDDELDRLAASHLSGRALLESDEGDVNTRGAQRRRAQGRIEVVDELELSHRLGHALHNADELEQKAAQKEATADAIAAQAPYVSVNPRNATERTIGGQQPIRAGQRITVAQWVGKDEDSRLVTCTAWPVQQLGSDNSGTGAFRPYAIVQFGTRGSMVQAEVDIGRGAVFQVPGSAVVLDVAMEVATIPATAPNDVMKLAGMLAFWPTQKNLKPTRTKYLENVANGTGQTIQVPAGAKDFIFWRRPVASQITFGFRDADGPVYDYVLAAGASMFDPIPLSGDIVEVVVDVAAADMDHGRAIFGLVF